MPHFSRVSLARLGTCDLRLQRVAFEVIKRVDFSVVCGHRDEADQEAAYVGGFSKVRWPYSRHNDQPSEALDFWPYPRPTPGEVVEARRFAYVAGLFVGVAHEMGIELQWGGVIWLPRFLDMLHIQLRRLA